MRNLSIIAVFLLVPCALMAQEKKGSQDPDAAAEARVQEYKETFELTDAQAAEMHRILAAAEKEAMPLRQQCQDIQARLHEQMDRSIAEAEAQLTPRQRAKLEQMRKEGKMKQTPVCATGSDGACCAAMSRERIRSAAPAGKDKPEVKPGASTAPPARSRPAR